MDYAGFYINLDHRADRRAEIEAELARHDVAGFYRHFPGILGNALNLTNPHLKAGEIGCFASHVNVLKENLGEQRHLHIIEDDVIFAPSTKQAIDGILEQGLFGDYDIVYTDISVPLLNDAYKAYKNFYDATVTRDGTGHISKVRFSVVNLQELLFGSASSYLVNKNAIAKLHGLLEQEINNAPQQPVDLVFRRLCQGGVLKVGCLFPFVTSVRLDHIIETDIDRSYHQMSALAAHLARYSFFVGADMDKCREYLDKYLPLPTQSDKHSEILKHLLVFSLTDAYRPL